MVELECDGWVCSKLECNVLEELRSVHVNNRRLLRTIAEKQKNNESLRTRNKQLISELAKAKDRYGHCDTSGEGSQLENRSTLIVPSVLNF